MPTSNRTNQTSRILASTAVALSAVAIAAGAWAQERTESAPQLSATLLEADVVPASGDQLAAAIVNDTTRALCFTGNSLSTAMARQVGTFGPATIQGFPTSGTDFGVLTTGSAANVPGVFTTYTSISNGFPDTATLTLNFAIGATPGNLTFDWKYGTEELPTWYQDGFQDPWSATLNPGGTTLASLTVDQSFDVLGANFPSGSSAFPGAPGPTPNDTQYNSMVPTTQVVTQDLSGVAGGPISVVMTISDVGDTILDSGVFLDNLSIAGCEEVGIDIKAGSFPNSINLDTGGAVPVAILGSDVLDVTNIDAATVTMADANVKTVGKADKLLCSIEDVSGDFTFPEGSPDGYDDLVCKIVTMDLNADCDVTSMDVSFEYNGILIEGSDSVNIVKDGVSCQP